MQKICPLSQKLSKLQPFSWIKSWRNLKSIKFSNLKILLTFWDLDQFFFLVKSIYISESINKVSRSNNNLEPLNWVWALCAPPGVLPGPRTPGLIGLKRGVYLKAGYGILAPKYRFFSPNDLKNQNYGRFGWIWFLRNNK